MSALVAAVGVSWACGPSGFGVPDAPPAPPPSTGTAPAPVTGPSSGAAPGSAATPSGSESGSATTRGADGGSSRGRAVSPRTPSRGGVGGPTSGGGPSAPTGQAQINARVNGATAGVVQQGRQEVFASSTSPRSASPGSSKQAGRGKAKARESATRGAPTASERSAKSDLWTGVGSRGTSSSLDSAAASAGEGGGLSGGMVAAIALLGLGLAGITGAAAATSGRRRRAARVAGEANNRE